MNLYQDLKDWRKRTADELQKPLFQVMNNKLIETITVQKPSTLEQLSVLSGVGPKTLQKYGRIVLDMVQKHKHDDDHLDKDNLEEFNKVSDKTFWASYVKPKPKKAKKAKPGDAEKATAKRRKRIEILSDSALAELKWPDIEFIDLNVEQQDAANHILEGNNVFLTGSAGTGKTFLLRYVIQELVRRHGEASVAVTAPTGIAAINIGGQTIHSFSGIGFGKNCYYVLFRWKYVLK
jgi:chromosomal replication initiation ATPase DnaA